MIENPHAVYGDKDSRSVAVLVCIVFLVIAEQSRARTPSPPKTSLIYPAKNKSPQLVYFRGWWSALAEDG